MDEISRFSTGVRFKYEVKSRGVVVPLAQFTSLQEFMFEGPGRQLRTLPAAALNSPGTDGWLQSDATPAPVGPVTFFPVGGVWKYRPHLVQDSGHDYRGAWIDFLVTT